jgi:hypothetical protein
MFPTRKSNGRVTFICKKFIEIIEVKKMVSKYLGKPILYMIALAMAAASIVLGIAGYWLDEHYIRIPIILLSIGVFALALAKMNSSE